MNLVLLLLSASWVTLGKSSAISWVAFFFSRLVSFFYILFFFFDHSYTSAIIPAFRRVGGWVRNFLSRALNFYTEWFSNLFRRQSIWKAWHFLKNTMKYWLIYLIPGYAIGTVLLPDNMTNCAWCKNCHLEYTCPRKEQAVGLNMIGCFWVVLVIFVCCLFTYFFICQFFR